MNNLDTVSGFDFYSGNLVYILSYCLLTIVQNIKQEIPPQVPLKHQDGVYTSKIDSTSGPESTSINYPIVY